MQLNKNLRLYLRRASPDLNQNSRPQSPSNFANGGLRQKLGTFSLPREMASCNHLDRLKPICGSSLGLVILKRPGGFIVISWE